MPDVIPVFAEFISLLREKCVVTIESILSLIAILCQVMKKMLVSIIALHTNTSQKHTPISH